MAAPPTRNQIKELTPGVYWSLLDYPEAALLGDLLSDSLPLVLVWTHSVGSHEWQDFALPTTTPTSPELVRARVVEYDLLLPTARFRELLPNFKPGIRAVQLATQPPDWLDMSRLVGKERWRVLNEVGWHVLLDTPGNDFGEVASPDRTVVERAIVLTAETSGDAV